MFLYSPIIQLYNPGYSQASRDHTAIDAMRTRPLRTCCHCVKPIWPFPRQTTTCQTDGGTNPRQQNKVRPRMQVQGAAQQACYVSRSLVNRGPSRRLTMACPDWQEDPLLGRSQWPQGHRPSACYLENNSHRVALVQMLISWRQTAGDNRIWSVSNRKTRPARRCGTGWSRQPSQLKDASLTQPPNGI